ncbi:hypothetical protein M9458_051096 [Cirrhinus mrigala]|uniref:Retrotransposon gag domain-containing protein n=1 Tax=Cirrhinus mrigala TaxID=683832 RepID=A0ABD0MYG6_CIRMR
MDRLLLLPLLLRWTLPVFVDHAIALDVTVCLDIDLACLDYDLFNKARTWILYASQSPAHYRILRTPKIQRLFGTQIKTMDPASRLFSLHQGNRPIEEYVVDFCELCHLVNFNDVALNDIFCHGLNEPIHSCLPGGKIHWTLEQYIDYALRLSGSPFTVGIADEGPRNPAVTTTPQPAQVTSTKPRSANVTSAKPQPVHVTSAKPRSANVTSAKPQPVHITSAKPQPAHIMLVSRSQTFRLTAEGLEFIAAFFGQGPPIRPFDRHVKQPITVHFVQRHVSGHRNVPTTTDRRATSQSE